MVLPSYFNSIKVRLEHLNYAQAKNAYANFNSIKVRLELGETFNQVSPFKLFQFHKGAIRTKRFWLVIITCSYFNSIKVRLELINSLMLQLFPKFQFHKGAIRTLRLRCCGQSRTPFQFHKGAIRTSILILWWMVVVHFNSIKVRLELYTPWGLPTAFFHFNSIKVRLERINSSFSCFSV